MLAPLPYDRPDDVVTLNEQTPQFASLSVTRYNYHDWRTRAKSFSGMAAFRPTSMTVTGSGDPERVPAKMITATLLPLLGVPVERGRNFTDGEDRAGGENLTILSAGFAQRRFPGGDAIGRTFLLDNRPYTVIGVLPRDSSSFSRRTSTSLSVRGRPRCRRIVAGIQASSPSRG